MKTTRLILAISVISAFFLCSCEKDNAGEDDFFDASGVAELEEPSYEIIEYQTYTAGEFANAFGGESVPETKCSSSFLYEIATLSYPSMGADGNPIKLSMKIAFPKGLFGKIKSPDYIILENHGTICSDIEAPSNSNPMTLAKALGNALVVCPDYEGYGITSSNDHPYICHEINAKQSVDAVFAAIDYLTKEKGIKLSNKCFLENYGYSQGGGIALAVHKYIETELTASEQKTLNLQCSYCGGGPYSPVTTYRKFKEWDELVCPPVAAMEIIGAKASYPDLIGKYDLSEFFSRAFVDSGIIEMIRSKQYSSIQLISSCSESGFTKCSDIFSPELFDENAEITKDLIKCLERGNLTTGWSPKNKVILYHSKGDNIVPMENCVEAYEGLKSGNISCVWAPLNSEHITTAIEYYMRYLGLVIVLGLI